MPHEPKRIYFLMKENIQVFYIRYAISLLLRISDIDCSIFLHVINGVTLETQSHGYYDLII